MEKMLAILVIDLEISGCESLKAKRGILLPFINDLRHHFNASVAELGHQDAHNRATLGCSIIGNENRYLQGEAQRLVNWVDGHWRNGRLLSSSIELL